MNMKHPIPILLFATLLLGARGASAQTGETLHRYALIAGSNDGGPNRVKLRYAHTDAKAMARVLRQLGGVQPGDSVLLLEPDRFDFEAGIAKMQNILKNTQQSGTRQELVIYFSGHSDEQGLLLGDDLVSYRELREAIQDLPADVRIAILDSCSSGVLTRGKGGTRRAPFLMDTSVNVKGHAFLTSASADESAQESDRVGGSFFTHYLISGLRGAADNNRDKKVTLNEAYQYAFSETLARTESTQAGPQHPGYDFQLKGSGDLVLTDLRGTSALLELDAGLSGRIYLRNRHGQLVAEINKAAGQPVSLGLDPGSYEITLDRGGRSLKGVIALNRGETARIAANQLAPASREVTVARGDRQPPAPLPPITAGPAPAPAPPVPNERIDGMDLIHQPFRMGVLPGVAIPYNRLPDARTVNRFALNFVGTGDYLIGGEIGVFANIRRYDVTGVQIASHFNLNRGSLTGAQAAGLYNYTDGALLGVQASGIFNFARRGAIGAQLGGIFNHSVGATRGMKAAGIFNYTGEAITGFTAAGITNIVNGPVRGFEGAGIANVNTRTSHGFQGAGILNINGASALGFQGAGIANINADSVWGFQGAGILNVSALGSSSGGQFAGISNYAESIRGAQISGILNLARDRMEGAQIGLINIGGTVRGAQVGLVNIAYDRLDGASVGLVNYAGNGILAPSVWVSDTPLVNVGIKMGGPYLYGIMGTGIHPIGEDPFYTLLLGFGGHMDFGRVWLDIDVIEHRFIDRDMWATTDFLVQLRPTIGFDVIEKLSLFVGPTGNLLVSTERDTVGWMPAVYETTTWNDYHLRVSVGFVAGLQYRPRWGEHNSR